MRSYFKPFILHKSTKRQFWTSIGLLLGAKVLNMWSPFILKGVIDGLSGVATATAATGVAGAFTLRKCLTGIGLAGLFKFMHTWMLCKQMDNITYVIQQGIKRLSSASFSHLFDLDVNYHKQNSKSEVFKMNRAIRSVDTGLRFTLGFFAPVVVEFALLIGALWFSCGGKYLANMMVTLAAYVQYTRYLSKKRVQEIKDKMKIDKEQEFYQNESILNYETVKQFNNESLQKDKFNSLATNNSNQAMKVQYSLSGLNIK